MHYTLQHIVLFFSHPFYINIVIKIIYIWNKNMYPHIDNSLQQQLNIVITFDVINF